jgi:ribulose-5-phosphate 4-epimerase/fuculose-1-phosphate aldolase
MEKLEHSAETIWKAKQLGNPKELASEEISRLIEISEETYGLAQDRRNIF